MKSKLRTLSAATMLSMALVVPAVSQAQVDPADQAAADRFFAIADRITTLLGATAARLEASNPALAARIVSLSLTISARYLGIACTFNPTDPRCG